MTDKEYPDSFAGYPESLAERRSDGVPNGGTIWTPRDALIRMLREVDEGLNVDVLVIAYRVPDPTVKGASTCSFKQATPDTDMSVGVMHRAIALMNKPE